MTRVVQIVADDGDVRVIVRAKIATRGALSKREVDIVADNVADLIAQALRNVSYTAFRAYNTKVRA